MADSLVDKLDKDVSHLFGRVRDVELAHATAIERDKFMLEKLDGMHGILRDHTDEEMLKYGEMSTDIKLLMKFAYAVAGIAAVVSFIGVDKLKTIIGIL